MTRFVLLALAVLVPSEAAAQGARFDRAKPAAAGLDETVLAGADSLVDRDLPALLGMAVLWRDRLVWERYWHGADSGTVLNVKSVSKSVLATLVGIAVQEGRLRLDQTVASVVPEFYARPAPAPNLMFREAVLRSDSAKRGITIRHLLTQTSGYAWDEGGSILSSFLVSSNPARMVAELALEATPGVRFNYTTGGTHLLAAVLTRAVGGDLRAYAERVLFGPAGMALREWDVDATGQPVGGSEMYFAVRDLLRFGQLYLSRGVVGGRAIVPADWIDQAWAKQADVQAPAYAAMVPNLDGYGYLWWRRTTGGRPMYCALGYGGQFVLVVPSRELVIAGGSTLDRRNPGLIPQFRGIFKVVDSILGARP